MSRSSNKEKQRKAGIPEKPRGQQTGRPGNPDKNRVAKADTPALRGRRKEANEMFADKSSQHMGAPSNRPRSNTPSIPAAMPKGQPLGQSGGEKEFKSRQAKSRSSKKGR